MEENFNNQQPKMQEPKRKEENVEIKRKKAKKAVITLSAIVVLFLGLQVYASTNGYGNVFFMIKNLITTGNPAGEQEIFLDKDITLSYKSIDLAEGLKIQANRLEIKDGKTKIYMSVKSENGDQLPLKYEVTTINNEGTETTTKTKITGKQPENNDYSSYEEVLTLDYEVEENNTIVVKISNSSDKELRTLEINLQTREIAVKGEKEFEKISEIELKKYLSLYSELNNGFNESDTLVAMAETLLEVGGEYEGYGIISYDVYREALKSNTRMEIENQIIKEIYGDKAKFEKIKNSKGQEVEVLKGISNYQLKSKIDWIELNDKEEDNYFSTTDMVDYRHGKCLKIEDISFENDIYTVKYIYLLYTGYDEDDDKLEDLPQYETTIKLKRNENNKYSKYEIVSLEKGTEIKDKVSTDENENTNENEDLNETNLTNYITSMNWERYESTENGLSFEYPTDFTVVKSPDRGIEVEMRGDAIGKDVDTGKAVYSKMKIRLYCNQIVGSDAVKDFSKGWTGYTTPNGDRWYTNNIDGYNTPGSAGYQKIENYVNYEDLGNGRYAQRMIEFETDNRNNYKVTNIINKVIGSTRLTKMANQYTDNTPTNNTTNTSYTSNLYNTSTSITSAASQNVDNDNWKMTYVGAISSNFKYPKNFEIYTYETSVHVGGGIEGINNENIYVGIDIERLPINDLEVREDLDRTVQSKDNNGWTDWKPVEKYGLWNPTNGMLTGGGVRRTYARTKNEIAENGTAIFVRFDFHTKAGLTAEHYTFIRNILENISSTGV